MNKNRRVRGIELGKNLLILLLTCSALWLAAQTRLMGPLRQMFREEEAQTRSGQSQTVERTGAILPMRLLAHSHDGMRYGALYSREDGEELFRQTAPLLAETMAGAQEPAEVARLQWERALTQSASICFDFQGEIPFSVLSGWISGESSGQEAVVRRLVLSVEGSRVDLYYQDERDGRYYRCKADVVETGRLEEIFAALGSNGAFYAFESEEYDMLDPNTMLINQIPEMQKLTAKNPIPAGQTMLETLAGEIGFAINPNGVYYAGEWVARSGNDTLRLGKDGTLSYWSAEDGGEHFPILRQGSAGAQFDMVESCRQLAAAVLEPRCGQARLYPISMEEGADGWEITFGYSVNGIPVRMEQGCAARFLVRSGRVVQFVMRARSYEEAGESSLVLPARQAAAALEAKGLAGEELLLVYPDNGGEVLEVRWAAADRATEMR